MHGICLQVCLVSNVVKGYGALRVNLNVVRVIVVTLKEPHPTWTGVGTTTHLLLVHSLAIDIEVAITIGVWIYSLYLFCRKFVVTVFQIVTINIGVEEL